MITSYSELKTSIAAFLHRSDLTAMIPEFIADGEARIYNEPDGSSGHRSLLVLLVLAAVVVEEGCRSGCVRLIWGRRWGS